jgi:hypothetical protein
MARWGVQGPVLYRVPGLSGARCSHRSWSSGSRKATVAPGAVCVVTAWCDNSVVLMCTPAGGDQRFATTVSSEPPSAASAAKNAYFDTLMELAPTDPEVNQQGHKSAALTRACMSSWIV